MKYSLLLIPIVITACSSKIDESRLVGEWQVSEFHADTPELSPMLIDAVRQDAISTTYILNEDKSFVEISNTRPSGAEGFWRFREEDNLLELIDEDAGTQPYFVRSVEANEMIWFQPMEGIGSLTIILKRINKSEKL